MFGLLYLFSFGLFFLGIFFFGNDCLYRFIVMEQFDYMLDFFGNGEYFFFWKFNIFYIIFEVYVKIYGWLGLGLFFMGCMYFVDMVIGWVKFDGFIVFMV